MRAFVLAIPPTLTVLVMIAVLQVTVNAHFIFAPLAASAFLVYRDPHARANHASVVVASQLIGFAGGSIAAAMTHTGYLAEAAALLVVIALLIALDFLHAPAVATALIFADSPLQVQRAWLFIADAITRAPLRRSARTPRAHGSQRLSSAGPMRIAHLQ